MTNKLVGQVELQELIDKKRDKFQVPMMALDKLEETFGVEVHNEEYDSNGWQVDFWLPVTFNNIRLTLSGSLWYGNFCFIREEN